MLTMKNPGDWLPLNVQPENIPVVGPYHDRMLTEQGVSLDTEA